MEEHLEGRIINGRIGNPVYGRIFFIFFFSFLFFSFISGGFLCILLYTLFADQFFFFFNDCTYNYYPLFV